MRYDNIGRFIGLAFVVGAVFGLLSGLIFGGGGGTAGAKSQTSSTSKVTATTQPAVAMTAEKAKAIGANELGRIPVLMYHVIGTPETELTRSAAHFRDDIALLKERGYFPINVCDLAAGNIQVPAGKSPVVLTFDDSTPMEYHIRDDGSLDPDSAVGIMQAAVKQGGWASRASFYVLLEVRPASHILFGQADKQEEKLHNLVNWGYEVGSHTVSHLNLRKASRKESLKQLYQSQEIIKSKVGNGYVVRTMSVPFGDYPEDTSILASGSYQGNKYKYEAAVAVAGGPASSPFSDKFRPYRIPRIGMFGNELKSALDALDAQPGLRFISDGDPATISAPQALPASLGNMVPDPGRKVIRY